MPTVFTHAAVAVAAGRVWPGRPMPAYFYIVAAYCSLLPDADVLAFAFGIPYEHMFGHRGFSHSFVGAALIGALGAWRMRSRVDIPFGRLWAFYSLVAASHGLLDALTDGGHGIAFFAPFSAERYFLPWTPVAVSPIGAAHFFSGRGAAVMASELKWIWLPAAFLYFSMSDTARAAAARVLASGKRREGSGSKAAAKNMSTPWGRPGATDEAGG